MRDFIELQTKPDYYMPHGDYGSEMIQVIEA